MDNKILIVENDADFRHRLSRFLGMKGYDVRESGTIREALAACALRSPDAIVANDAFPDGDVLGLVAQIGVRGLVPRLVVVAAHPSVEQTVQLMKAGAENILPKPVDFSALAAALERTHSVMVPPTQKRGVIDPFIGNDPRILELASEATRVARADSPVLILGETGVGKGVLARWLHRNSRRAAKPLVELNCATFSSELLESELFGHERGAFTGAVQKKVGLLEHAEGGMVFLDEIAEMDLRVQPKLLKVLEDRSVRRVGDVRDRPIDVRFIAATHQDLDRVVAEKRFRSDLLFRINMITLVVPPLRERVADLPVIARQMAAEVAAGMAITPPRLDGDVIRTLARHSWPGNLRELRNVIERALLLSDGGTIRPRDLRLASAFTPVSSVATLREMERAQIEEALRTTEGSVSRAAARLGVPRSSLYRKLKKLTFERSVETGLTNTDWSTSLWDAM